MDDSYENGVNIQCINLLLAHFICFRSLCATVLRADFDKIVSGQCPVCCLKWILIFHPDFPYPVSGLGLFGALLLKIIS